MKTVMTAFLAIACSTSIASQPTGKSSDLDLIHQLAMKPFSAVVDLRCEIRGAVWLNGPKPGVNIELINSAGHTFKGTTGASGAYSISVPYRGMPFMLVERITDPIYVRGEAIKTARIFQPTIACDHHSSPKA